MSTTDQKLIQTKQILQEMELIFSRDEVVGEINEIKKLASEIQDEHKRNIEDARQIIKQMTAEVTAKEREVLAPSGSVHELNLEKYRKDKENISGQVDRLRSDVDRKRESINKMISQALTLKEKAAEYASADASDKTNVEYALKLYGHISNISWDYDNCSRSMGDSLPAQIAGIFGHEGNKEFHPFVLDTRSMSSYELADTLWKKIEGGLAV